jgi:hypothetical protein
VRSQDFTLTDDHVKLLHAMFVGWEDCEAGAPAVDCKRPYGSSYVPGDVREILGWPSPSEDDDDADRRAYAIHRETELALQIVLRHGPKPGHYRLVDRSDRGSWQLVNDE